jgi:hypothetical protein
MPKKIMIGAFSDPARAVPPQTVICFSFPAQRHSLAVGSKGEDRSPLRLVVTQRLQRIDARRVSRRNIVGD